MCVLKWNKCVNFTAIPVNSTALTCDVKESDETLHQSKWKYVLQLQRWSRCTYSWHFFNQRLCSHIWNSLTFMFGSSGSYILCLLPKTLIITQSMRDKISREFNSSFYFPFSWAETKHPSVLKPALWPFL